MDAPPIHASKGQVGDLRFPLVLGCNEASPYPHWDGFMGNNIFILTGQYQAITPSCQWKQLMRPKQFLTSKSLEKRNTF